MSTIAAGWSRGMRLAGPGEGLLTNALLVLLVWITAAAVAGSHWVPGSEAVIPVAMFGALFLAALAVVAPRGVTYWLATEVAMVLVLFLSTAHHSGDPGVIATDVRTWVAAIAGDLNTALLVTMVGGTWLGVAWAAYWVLRRGQSPLGLGPMAVVLAFEVVDDPSQSAITFLVVAWMVIAGLLLLRHTVVRVEHRWGPATAPGLSSSVGIQGSRALVLMLVAASLIPRLNTTDISPRFFSGSFDTVGGGVLPLVRQGPGGSFASTGYNEKVQPGGTLSRSLTPVMEVTTNFPRTTYLRGIDLYADSNGAWAPGSWVDNLVNVPADQALAEDPYLARHTVHATIKILGSGENTIFWPGDPLFASIPAQVRGAIGSGPGLNLPVGSVAGAYARSAGGAGTTYTVDATVSVATEEQLRGAGTNYPPSVTGVVPGLGQGAGPVTVDDRITTLATQVVAGQSTPYDQVKAIESYMRTKLKYNLQVSTPPGGQDPVIYFLFNSHVGYCEYFASAMGEMVRGLGIPVRLVSGYGPGVSEAPQDVPRPRATGTTPTPNLIRATDAHTWVEVFFPTYGWVPFEPTPDPIYPTLSRQAFDPAIDTFPAVVAPTVAAVPPPAVQSRRPAATTPVLGQLVTALVAGGLGLLVLMVLAGLLVARGPRRLRSPEVAWRRLGWLAVRLGRPRRPTDTPIEFARQLAASLPRVAGEISDLGGAYSQWCYRRDGIVGTDRHRAEDAWRRLRRVMVRELLWPRGARPAT